MDKKKCTKCGLEKPVGAFHRKGGKRAGARARCKNCTRAENNAYNAAHREHLRVHNRAMEEEKKRTIPGYREQKREQKRKSRAKNVALYRQRDREYAVNNRHRHRAREMVRRALVDGRLRQEACWCAAFSGGTNCYGTVRAHHEDYDEPLKVIWLCDRHHVLLHSKRKRRAAACATLSTD